MDARTPNAIGIEASAAPAGVTSGDRVPPGYHALRTAAAVVDRTSRTRTLFSGNKSAEVLTGLVTNDVLSLTPGHGQYAAALTPKSKIIADLRIFARIDGLLVDTSSRAGPGWQSMVSKFVNPRLAKYADVGETLSDLGVFGPQSQAVVADLTGCSAQALADLPAYGHLSREAEGGQVMVARVPDAGIDGYDLIAAPEVVQSLTNKARSLGVASASAAAFDVLRIEAGRPEWGLDMDESTLPQEANLDELGAISYTKGCYTGQETVARVHFRGHVNRHLRGVRFVGPLAPPHGSELVEPLEGRVVGDVRSAVISPQRGGIALAMMRREVEDGAALTARWAEGSLGVVVSALPFTDPEIDR